MACKFLKLLSLAMIAAGGHVRAEQLSITEPQATPPIEALLVPLAGEPKPANPEILAAHSAMVAAFNRALGEYRAHRNADNWRIRVGIDRRLLRAAGKLPPEYLAGRLDAARWNMEVQTAVAVCLGEGSQQDPPEFVAGLLVELLGSPVERVRYRSAEAIVQRVQDGTMPAGINDQLIAALDQALLTETNALLAGSMTFARQLLKTEPQAE